MRTGIKIWTTAQRDIVDNADHIARDSLAAAIGFLDAFDETVDHLLAFPGAGSLWETDSPKYLSIRFFPVKKFPKHIVFYRPSHDGIEVIRVCHASRDLQSLFNEDS